MLTRRRFISTFALLPFAALGGARDSKVSSYLSACSDRRGKHFLAALDADGALRFQIPLPGRAHAVAVHPSGEYCMVVARRPDNWLLAVHCRSGAILARAALPDSRHAYGHGVFDPAGQLFYVTENDFDAGKGVIGVYRTESGLRRLGELPSHGVGPHELALMPDGRTLVVANGGIRTHPDSGRAKLNLSHMESSLVYIDCASGTLLEAVRFENTLRQLSIRHLAVVDGQRVAVATQYQGHPVDKVPLVALHARGKEFQTLAMPEPVRNQLRQYCGSVAVDRSGQWLAVSAPRGNQVCIWALRDGFADAVTVPDGCGICASAAAGEFILSNGLGEIHRYRCNERRLQSLQRHTALRWDNHMARI